MQENHSFDNYFGVFPGVTNGLNLGICLPWNLTSPSQGCVKPFDADSIAVKVNSYSLGHSGTNSRTAYDGGKLDGFVYSQFLSRHTYANFSMAYYTNRTLPDYWDYASYYGLNANFFSSAITTSYPNHLYAVAAQSGGITHDGVQYDLTFQTIADELNASGISWKYYTAQWNDKYDCTPLSSSTTFSRQYNGLWNPLVDFPRIQTSAYKPECESIANLVDLRNDIQSGNLPSVAWISPNKSASEHPGQGGFSPFLSRGQLYTSSIINEISSNPSLWSTTAIFVTWDEFGGYYDNVIPNQVDKYGFGFRVPLLVISPYVKPGISYGSGGSEEDFSAFLSTIESNWGLHSLTARDASDAPLWYMFNFAQPPLEPLILPSHSLATYPWQSCVSKGNCGIGSAPRTSPPPLIIPSNVTTGVSDSLDNDTFD